MGLLITACVIVWVAALVLLCSRRDIEIHRKLSWVVTVLVLNILGALIYFFFGPPRRPSAEPPCDPDAVPVTPAGKSWNPIVGVNRMAPGEGFNPVESKTDGTEK